MRILVYTAIVLLTLLSLQTCQVQGGAPNEIQASIAARANLARGPIDTGGFLIYSPPTATQAKRLTGAYWRQHVVDTDGAIVREAVRRWTLRDVAGLDATKVTTFNTTDPMLSESAGPYVLSRVMTGDSMYDLLDAVEAVAGVRPAEDMSDVRFLFWGYNGEFNKVPLPLAAGGD
jgi:hypothetical protein